MCINVVDFTDLIVRIFYSIIYLKGTSINFEVRLHFCLSFQDFIIRRYGSNIWPNVQCKFTLLLWIQRKQKLRKIIRDNEI